eukprot:8257062-Prorocentrum_lima.AAC.1
MMSQRTLKIGQRTLMIDKRALRVGREVLMMYNLIPVKFAVVTNRSPVSYTHLRAHETRRHL